VAGLIGVAAIVLSVVALFRGRDGAADVALLAVGAVFALIAVVDLVPSRVKFPGVEVDFYLKFLEKLAAEHPDAIEPTVAALADTAQEEGRQDLAALALSTLKAVGAVRAVGYEGHVVSAIGRALPKGASFVDNMDSIDHGLLSDPDPQLIVRGDGTVVLVHIYEQQRLWGMKRDVSTAAQRKDTDDPDRVRRLWITEDEPNPVAKTLLVGASMRYVVWRSSSDDKALRAALAEIFSF